MSAPAAVLDEWLRAAPVMFSAASAEMDRLQAEYQRGELRAWGSLE